jgi:hypothetical protein
MKAHLALPTISLRKLQLQVWTRFSSFVLQRSSHRRTPTIPFFNYFFQPSLVPELTAALIKSCQNLSPMRRNVLQLLPASLAHRLNATQNLALEREMTCPFSTITGLAGTGKTETLAAAMLLCLSLARDRPVHARRPLILVLGRNSTFLREVLARYLQMPGAKPESANLLVSIAEIEVFHVVNSRSSFRTNLKTSCSSMKYHLRVNTMIAMAA